MIPQSYQEWHHTITVKCGLALTEPFIKSRIAALKDDSDSHTQQFVKLYGRDYLDTVIGWFTQAQIHLDEPLLTE